MNLTSGRMTCTLAVAFVFMSWDACIAGAASAASPLKPKWHHHEEPSVGIAFNLPVGLSTGAVSGQQDFTHELVISRSKQGGYIRIQNFPRGTGESTSEPSHYVIEIVRQHPTDTCQGKRYPLPRIKSGYWCRVAMKVAEESDANRPVMAFIPVSDNPVLFYYYGDGLGDRIIAKIVNSIRRLEAKEKHD